MTLPKVNGELKFDENGNLLLDGKKVLYKRVRRTKDELKVSRKKLMQVYNEGSDEVKKALRQVCSDIAGEVIGVIVATDEEHVGFAKVHSKLDNFNRDYGLRVALRRAELDKDYLHSTKEDKDGHEIDFIPTGFKDEYIHMKERAKRYYGG